MVPFLLLEVCTLDGRVRAPLRESEAIRHPALLLEVRGQL